MKFTAINSLIFQMVYRQRSPLPLILLLAALWGPSFLFIKLIVQVIPPVSLVALRFSLASLLLLFILRVRKIPLSRDLHLWKHCFMMGILTSTLPVLLCAYSLEHIDSILSALINGNIPIIAILLAHVFLKDEPLTFNRVIGILLGLLGFLVLFLPDFLNQGFGGTSYGMLLSFGAAISYALSMIYARRFIKAPKEPLVLPTMQILSTLPYLWPLAWILNPNFNFNAVPLTSWLSLGGLTILGTVIALMIYYRIVLNYTATALSTVTYIVPIFSTLYGVVFLHEAIGLSFCLAASLILLGTMLAIQSSQFPLRLKQTEVPDN